MQKLMKFMRAGFPIKYALRFAKFVREKDPNIPIVWGGVHPTLLPEQTASSPYVDVVVRGEGAATLVELFNRYKMRGSIEDVKGITFKSGNIVKSNPDRAYIDLNAVDAELPYHLVDLNKYPLFKEQKNLQIHTSRGCPFRCGFCYNLMFNKRSYRFKTSGKARVLFLEFGSLLFMGKFKLALSDVKAVLWNIKNLPDTSRLHKQIQRMRVADDHTIQRKMIKKSLKMSNFRMFYNAFKKVS